MASTQLGTTDDSATITHGRNIVVAGSRLYAVWGDSTNLVYYYSDNDGGSWTGPTTIIASATRRGNAFYDATNGRLNFVYSAGNSATGSLRYRAITSNVTSGAPGALSTEVIIDDGSANGVSTCYAFHSPTGTRPRYWIIALKVTTAGTAYETRAWNVDVTTVTDADTAGNWVTTNFTNLGGNSNGISNHMGCGVYWTIGGNPRVTLVFGDGEINTGGVITFEAVTFDPTVATPTPGTVTVITATQGSDSWMDPFTEGPACSVAAKADYLVFGSSNGDVASSWDFQKTVDGTTWTQPTGWTGLTMGRAALALGGSDFYVVHSASYGAIDTTAQAMSYRKIIASSDSMGSTSAFSDTNANTIAIPADTGSAKLYALYRGSTGTPWTVRSDYVALTTPQILLPDADTAEGGWTTAPLFSKVNDSSDATIITATAS